MKRESFTVWLTGLSGSGKSTLASELQRRLAVIGCRSHILDGDNVRRRLNRDLGFTPADRTENIRRIAEVSRLFNEADVIVIAAFISPYADDRSSARDIIGVDRFVEIWLTADLATCEGRDVKGLYAKARRGNIPDFTGVSAPYEVPEHPDLALDTASRTVDDCIEEILRLLAPRIGKPSGERVRRIAMWSGPRNISSAMMRSWGNRPDTVVCDEPLYAHYLLKTGTPHPGADEVIRSQETDWRKVAQSLTEFDPPGKTIFYQKHMTHHLLPEIDREWLDSLTNVFLIREPREVVTSFAKVAGVPRLEETGLPQQLDLFNWVRTRTGRIPPVVDSRDVLENPKALLRLLCDSVGVDFNDSMLEWPPGPRDTDGVWAKYWYDAVLKSTTFQPYKPKDEPVPANLGGLLREAEKLYSELHAHRLRG